MTQLSLIQPVIGQPDTTEDVKIQNAFTAIQNVINGNLDSGNVTAATAQSASVNQSGQVVKGSSIIATSETRTNTVYGTMPTPDQVQNVVLSTNGGLIAVWYQATWQSSVGSGGQAAIFIGANQLKVENASASTSPLAQSASMGTSAATNAPLATYPAGLISTQPAGGYTGDVTTGQAVGAFSTGSLYGGPCYIFAAAGTYSVSIQFLASTGSVTASNRRLYVQAISFV